MLQDFTAEEFYLQLRHLMEDADATAFDAQQLGRAVNLAVAFIKSAVAPLNAVPNLHKRIEENPQAISGDILGEFEHAEATLLPVEFKELVAVNAGGHHFSVLPAYDEWAFSKATTRLPLACQVNKYLFTAPITIGQIYIHYIRMPYRSYLEDTGTFPSTTTLTVSGQTTNQWVNGLLWKKGTTWTDNDDYHNITANTPTLITFSGAVTADADEYRLFQTPDISKELLTGVLYRTALILEGGDPTGGDWLKSFETCLSAFINSGGEQ